jgi:translation elongation factor EF-1alpha
MCLPKVFTVATWLVAAKVEVAVLIAKVVMQNHSGPISACSAPVLNYHIVHIACKFAEPKKKN